MNNRNEKKLNDKALKTISQANKKAVMLIIFSIIFSVSFIGIIFYYFFISKLDIAKKNDEPLYFSVLFIDDNNDIYGAYVGIISSLNNRIGLIGLPRNIALWESPDSSPRVINELYKNGGENAVFRAIENSVNKKITYRIAIDNNQISDIIDLIGGVKMYVEEPINFKDEEKGYELLFDIGEWMFTGKKIISYLHYLNMKGYEDIETLYRLEDVIVNSMIALIQSPQLRSIIHSKDMRNALFSKIKSNLRPPDMKAIMNILANSNERTLVIENIDTRVDDNGILTPIFEGSAFIKQMDDLTLYVELKTQKSELNNEDVSLTVLNATTVGGLADRINIRMRYRGFAAGEYGNFGTNLNESVVLIRDGQIEKAFMVANEGRVTRVYAKTDRRVLNNAVLILGNDYYEITQ
ncbi:LCP family protein [Brachyspira hyodysenteriae]|uniref:LCP family protein n=1 Tax=Brachyspira hyodysenteriae TaxID=159 RepID=UPI002B25836C|nr:LCP family protein [Brachyspira hyodysenteriae]WPC38709.1 LCP family protein [Brachyspira hyodysenteriae]